MFCVAAVALLLFTSNVSADTKRVEVKANKAQWIDGIGAVNRESCGSMIATPKIKSEAQHGRLEIKLVSQKLEEGPCKGKTIKVLGVAYYPKRGFRGTDNATINWRQPRSDYYIGQELRLHTRKYHITVE